MGTGDHNAVCVCGGGGGVILRWTSIPSGGGSIINFLAVRFMLQKRELSAVLMGLLARM